jgi:uncharacterized membrane protein YczE
VIVPPDRLGMRLVRCAVGLACFGVGISALIAAGIGLAPWDVLHQGLSELLGLSIGTLIILVGVILLVVNYVILDERAGIGTFLNALEIGLVVDLVADRLPRPEAVAAQLAYVTAGIVLVGIGSGLYIGSGLGAGPRDGLMMGLHHRGMSLRLGRTAIEAGVLVLGVLLGGSVGIGTVAFVLAVGPAVHYFLPRLSMPTAQLSPAP